MSFRPFKAILLAAGLLALASPASADAIDGHWCSSDSRHFTIEGSNFTTPAGASITGEYDRHAYRYTVPDNEPDAGKTVDMALVDENTIHLTVGADGQAEAPIEVWRRCELTT